MSLRTPVIAAIALLLLTFAAAACDGDNEATTVGSPTAATTVTTTEPAGTPDPTADVTPDDEPAITIEEPELGAILTVPFTASGTANVFEAALTVQVLTEDGRLLCQRNIMATAGTGTRGDWSTTFAFPPLDAPEGQVAVPGIVRALSYSPRDGAEENVVTVDVNLSSERPAIVITEPTCLAQASATGTLEISGYAEVFEGTVNLELRDGQDNVVVEAFATTTGAGEEAPWATTLDLSGEGLEPGVYELVAFEASADDGARQNEFAIPIVLMP